MPSETAVVAIGAASLDIKGRLVRDFISGTSNAATVRLSAGGVARNIAENLVRLGLPTTLIAAVCEDDFGRAIIDQTGAAGVDVSAVMTTCIQHSAAYIAIIGSNAELLAGLDDSSAARAITPEWIEQYAALLRNAQMVVVDANVTRATANYVLDLCEKARVPVALEPVAYGLASRFKDQVGRFTLVLPNLIEAEALSGQSITDISSAIKAAQHLVTLGTKIAVITLAHEGVVYATEDEVGHVPAMTTEVIDPTGAGEAMAAAIIYGLTNDIPIAECVRLGVIAATLTLRSPETVAPEINLEYLYAQLEL
ncbi:MAG TPA: carbohydrate kinase family protein [Herpetosiphonaceae bacterium]|nr:carbohydrate kinase family protein [Herpetosiphonaceae bacterium]